MENKILRFSRTWRVQHMLLMISVFLLILSGFSLKYSHTLFGKVLIFLEGGFEARGSLHRFSAFILIFTTIYHVFYIFFTKEGRKEFKLLLPCKRDFFDLINSVLYNIGKIDKKPEFDRYSYKEKLQYWTVSLFLLLMIFSGVILMFHDFFFYVFPKWIFDLSFAVHSWTATLFIIFLVLWHFYIVHLSPSNFPINLSFWNGYVDEEWLKENHYLEYKRLKEK
ncbi:MAG: cytochrome b/b6 domain-containing protein [Candidatus Hydrothermales bacterium]